MNTKYTIYRRDGTVCKWSEKLSKSSMDAAIKDCGDGYVIAASRGDYISAQWDHTGRKMEFISHGGGHGEWR